MASQSASSWHPAMMPNSAADLVVQESKSKSKHVEPLTHVDSAVDSTVEESRPTEILPDQDGQDDQDGQGDQDNQDEAGTWLISEDTVPAEPIEISHPSNLSQHAESTEDLLAKQADTADAWLTNGDEGEGGAWLLQDEGAHKVETTDNGSVDEEAQSLKSACAPAPTAAPALDEQYINKEPAEPKTEKTNVAGVKRTGAAPSMAQHSSSMSFARTVSHEISFGDDDDGEWNLGRAETDTFEFMPPSDRTNSFPAVPPMAPETEARANMPLLSKQVLDVMEEDEKEAEVEEEEYMMRSPEGDSSASWHRHGTTRPQHSAHRPIGGEIEEAAAIEEEARFEEGLPLIPQTEAVVGDDTQQTSARGNPNPFGEQDEDNGDNFFGQMQSNEERQHGYEDGVRSLERKSTMQVMEAMGDGGPLTRHSTLNETSQEHGDDSTQGVTLGASDTAEDAPATEDLASKWEQAFGDDDEDEFLLDDSTIENKDVDATAFLGSDDEGLLDDDVDDPAPDSATYQPRQPAANPYEPAAVAAPSTTPFSPAGSTYGYGPQQMYTAPFGSAQFGQTPQPLRPEPAKTQSFVDKSKVGYSSPYDLPTDLVKPVKPRKRPSLQHLLTETAPPPSRSAGMYAPGQSPRPPSVPAISSAPPTSAAAGTPQGPPEGQKASAAAAALRSKASFFEELPMSSKPRPASRQSQRAPSPGQYLPTNSTLQQASLPPPPPVSKTVPPPRASQVVPPPVLRTAPPPAAPPPHHPNEEVHATPLGIANLVAPPKSSPYAMVQSHASSVTPPSSGSSRYSPAPPGPQGGGVSIISRYSPAPSAGSRPNSSYSAGSTHTALPHLPRTSSPLANYETSGNADAQPYDRRASSSFEPRLNRVSSLPPTREVDEEEDEEAASPGNRSFSASHAVTSPTAKVSESRYSPAPPDAPAAAATASLPKRLNPNYAPQPAAALAPAQTSFVPPPRAQTQSPSASHSDVRKGSKPAECAPQPLSAHAPAPAPAMTKPVQSAYAPMTSRTRGQSITNMMPPSDGRERDPLERWRGTPIMAWGVGGAFVTSFPKSVPRYVVGQTAPVSIRTVGEVKVQNIKDLDPLQDRLAKFPGPLKGKSKKKEAAAWLTAGIDVQEREIPDVSFHSQLSLEAKRSVERLLLWKLLRIFIENDGVLEGIPAVEKAVRQVLAPETAELRSEGALLFTGAGVGSGATLMKADGVDSGAVEKIRLDLLKGDRETAVWAAVDKRLWGHAMLISQTVSADLYKQVAQEFVRKEVNYPGHNNESLAALYKILSGNYDDCVDELVPSHARAGLQLVSTETSSGPTKDAMDGLDKWRETLTLVLSNRSSGDIRGLHALGKLLSSYGRAEAAHICFIFSRSLSVFGGLDDSNSDFVLVGSDHRRQSDQFAKETEALQLSEIYEYGLTLGSGVAASAGAPHLAAYKLQHAVTLAEHGFRDKAMQYCDAIASAIVAQTRRSPYHHAVLEASVEDFLARLKSSPKDASSSWMSKPTMGKVSDSMWNRFNKFVSGDEDANGHAGSDGDNGPFARITSPPNVSRPPSTSNFDVYGPSPGYQPAGGAPLTSGTGPSRYALAPNVSFSSTSANPYAPATQPQPQPQPQPQYAPASASGRSSQEYAPNPHEPICAAVAAFPAQSQSGGYQPTGYPGSSPSGYQPIRTSAPGHAEPASTAQPPAPGGYQPYGLQESPHNHPQPSVNEDASQGYEPPSYGYEAPQSALALIEDSSQGGAGTSGYEPPSLQPYGYEAAPSYQPEVDDDEAPKPKKKSFMDHDDEDDILAFRKPQQQKKSDKDRENEEMFRKAAEEDAKRAAAAAAASNKKGWGFGGWFGGGKKADGNMGDPSPGKPIKAKLGEQSTFVYDPDLGRWINKKPGAENVEVKRSTPPPPRAGPRSVSGTPPPSGTTLPPAAGRRSVPPMGMPTRSARGNLSTAQSMENLNAGAPPAGMPRSVSTSNVGVGGDPPSTGPPSRPATSMSNANSIDDLLGAPASRKAGQKKPRKSGRYVDVMAK